MKVLFITSSTILHGGGSKAFLQMLEGLVALGIQPFVIFPDKQGLYQVFRSKNICCAALSYRMSVYPRVGSLKDKLLFLPRLVGRFWLNSLATLRLIKIVKRFNPDIIHTNVSVIAIGYYVARLLKIPHVWHIREYGDKDFNLHYYPSRAFQLKRYQQVNSYELCITKDIQRYNNLQDNKNSFVVYDGVLSEKNCVFQKEKKSYFLFAGRLEKAKGILLLIDAYAEYCKLHINPLPLYVAGSGSEVYTQLVQSKISQYGLESKVILLGMRRDILSLYKDAKALIVPSISEGFGFITAEAMFSGCLVIGNNTAGTKEQFDNGKNMLGDEIALRYSTQKELVTHLVRVTDNSIDIYNDMIFRAQKVVLNLYSVEVHSKKVYDFYNLILKRE